MPSLLATSTNVTLIMPTVRGLETLGNTYHQLGCSPMVAAFHFNEGVNAVVPTLTTLVAPGIAPLMYDTGSSWTPPIQASRDGKARGGRAVIGPSRSTTSAFLSLLGGLDSIPMCSYWSSSPTLSNKVYPLFGRTYPSDAVTTLVPARNHNIAALGQPPAPRAASSRVAYETLLLPKLIKDYGWSSIGVVHENDNYANAYSAGLVADGPSEGERTSPPSGEQGPDPVYEPVPGHTPVPDRRGECHHSPSNEHAGATRFCSFQSAQGLTASRSRGLDPCGRRMSRPGRVSSGVMFLVLAPAHRSHHLDLRAHLRPSLCPVSRLPAGPRREHHEPQAVFQRPGPPGALRRLVAGHGRRDGGLPFHRGQHRQLGGHGGGVLRRRPCRRQSLAPVRA